MLVFSSKYPFKSELILVLPAAVGGCLNYYTQCRTSEDIFFRIFSRQLG
jgi:hypothetical protein